MTSDNLEMVRNFKENHQKDLSCMLEIFDFDLKFTLSTLVKYPTGELFSDSL